MTRWFMGSKGGSHPMLRVMKDDADDPVTTPSTDWQKFIFDSTRAHKIGYIPDIFDTSYDIVRYPNSGPSGGVATYYEPVGSSEGSAREKVWTYRAGNPSSTINAAQSRVIFPEKLGLSFEPLMELRSQRRSDGRATGCSSGYYRYRSRYGGEFGNVRGFGAYTSTYANGGRLWVTPVDVSRRFYSPYGLQGTDVNGVPLINYSMSTGSSHFRLTTAFELPSGDQPMPTYASTPVPGQRVLRFSPEGVGMAYPGHDVNEPGYEAHIFNGSRVPAKVIGTGEIWVGSGANVKVFTKRSTTQSTYLDFMLRRSDQAQFSHPPIIATGTAQTDKLEMEYAIEADGVRIFNIGTMAFYCRYIVFADDNSAPTSGGLKVFNKGNDGAQDFIQLKLPGSSDTNPGLNETILDLRLPFVPIVDEGWIPASAFTESGHLSYGIRRKTIYFTNNGFIPFVKYLVSWGNGVISHPVTNIIRTWDLGFPNYDKTIGGDSTSCVIFNDRLDFYNSSGNPVRIDVDEGVTGPKANPEYGPGISGIRWYLFAIPNSL